MNNRENYKNLSEDDRKRLIEQICIVYPRFNRLIETIDRCREYTKISAEPENMLITGETGTGKSTLCRFYMAKFPRYQTDTQTVCIVLYVTVPVPATIKGLATALLAALGDTVPEKGTTVSQTRRLINLIAKCQVEIILLDEFQHFLERESSTVLQEVSDWLKNLMNQTKVSIILVGMPKSAAVLDHPDNEQLKRRFSYRESISSFGWKTEAEKTDFRTFLQELDNLLPFQSASNFTHEKLAHCIFNATNGAIYNVMKLVRHAASLAVEEELEKVSVDCLKRAFEEKLAKNNPKIKNPFRSTV